jgi:hypothetical protein
MRTRKTIEINSRSKVRKPSNAVGSLLPPTRAKKKNPRMSDVTDLYDGQIRLYRTTHSGDVYQLRMWVSEEKKYIRKSLRTRDKNQAIRIAEQDFILYKSRLLKGEKIFSVTAKDLRTKYLEHIGELLDGKQLSKGRVTNIRVYTKHYLDFVGEKTPVQGIKKKFFRGYRAFRQKELKSIKMTVVRNESITIKQMYKWAIEEGYVSAAEFPDFGKIVVPKDDTRRDGYTMDEYRQLVDVAKFWYRKANKSAPNYQEDVYYRRSIRDFIVLMSNMGFRTGELHQLKYSEVTTSQYAQKTKSGSAPVIATVQVLPETTKVRKGRVVKGPRGDVFDRRKTYSTFHSEEDYVFSMYEKRALISKKILYQYYSDLKDAAKEKYEDFDTSKDIYALRHLWITNQLLIGQISPYKIARYAGTSLQQIQNHYDHVKDAQISDELLKLRFKPAANEDGYVDMGDKIDDDGK